MSYVQGAYPKKLGLYSYDVSVWTLVLLDLSESMAGTYKLLRMFISEKGGFLKKVAGRAKKAYG